MKINMSKDTNESTVRALFGLADPEYRDFHARLMPTVEKQRIIGVRTPELRKYAKALSKTPEGTEFICSLPHYYYEENNLHAFIIEGIKDYDECIMQIDRFLPYVDNWATCDMLSPKVFSKHKEQLIEQIKVWLRSDKTYTVRFGIKTLMNLYLDGAFKPDYLALVCEVRSEEYYIKMAAAWFFATALAKQYPHAVKIIESRSLDELTHNKAIQKARESRRLTPEQKEYLKSLKI